MQSPPAPSHRSPPALATLILLSGLSALGMNIFLPSLPNMTEYFQTDYRLIQLSVALYLAVNSKRVINLRRSSRNMTACKRAFSMVIW